MTILVGCDIPGLLSALEQAAGGSQRLTVLHEAEAIAALVRNSKRRIDALILSDGLMPPADTDIATALWQLVSFVARERRPAIPTLLTLRDDTPTAVSEALRAEAQRTGGDVLLVPRGVYQADQAEAQQLVARMMGYFAFESQRRRYTLVALSDSGGVGTTSALVSLSLQLARLGLRVLLVDCARGTSGVATWLKIEQPESNGHTVEDEQSIAAQIIHHDSGVDVLLARSMFALTGGMEQPQLDVIADALKPLNYDVISFDGLWHWQERADVRALLARPATSPLVLCPPGAKERTAAHATLEALGEISCENGQTALDATMLLFVEGERGQIKQIKDVKRDMLQRHPMISDLGTLPRDPALLSMVTEADSFRSIFDLAPKRPYCHAVRSAVRQWIAAVDMPATWLIQPDPYERLPRKRFWLLRRPEQSPSMQAAKHEPISEQPQYAVVGDAAQTHAEQPLFQESIVTTALHSTAQQEAETQAQDEFVPNQPLPSSEASPSSQTEATIQTTTGASWLDTVRQHQRGRLLRAPVPEQQGEQ